MSTLALLGLLVVVLVAVGIAAFLRWGRSRDGHPTARDDERPRTVADLVDRRARGVDDHPAAAPVPDAGVDPAGAADRADEAPDDDGGTDRFDEVPTSPRPRPAVGSTVSSVPDISEVRDDEVRDDDEPGPGDAAAGSADERTGDGNVPARSDSPRITPDVHAGPVGPPWSRGFKDGKPVEPVERPAPRPAPTPRPVTPRPAAEPVAGETPTGPGPISSAPDISAPRDTGTTVADEDRDDRDDRGIAGSAAGVAGLAGVTALGPRSTRGDEDTTGAEDATTIGAEEEAAEDAATGDAAAGDTPEEEAAEDAATGDAAAGDTPEEEATDESATDESATDESATDETAAEDVAAGDAAADDRPDTSGEPSAAGIRPAAPPRADSRSPVDPDLVKRVTAVPADRAGTRAAATPDTEREFREARDRITGQPVWRVPEQAGASEPTGQPTPSPQPEPASTGPAAGAPEGEDDDSTPDDSDPDNAGPRSGAGRVAAASAGLAAAGAAGAMVSRIGSRGAPSDDEAPEPPPRPAPRVLRSVRPAGGPPPAATPAPPNVGTGGPPPPAGPARTATPEPGTPGSGTTDAGTTDPIAPSTPETGQAEQTEETAPPVSSPTAVPATARPDLEDTVVFEAVRPGPEPAAVVPGTAPQDVEVRVHDQDGEPLAGAEVALRDRAGRGLASAATGTDGVATVIAPGAGQYVLVATSTGHRPGVTACAVAEGPVAAALTVRRSAALHGTVRTASGAAVTQVPVAVEQDGEAVAAARTGDDGAFRITDLDAGWYRVVTEVGGSAVGTAVQVPAGSEVGCELTGRTGS